MRKLKWLLSRTFRTENIKPLFNQPIKKCIASVRKGVLSIEWADFKFPNVDPGAMYTSWCRLGPGPPARLKLRRNKLGLAAIIRDQEGRKQLMSGDLAARLQLQGAVREREMQWQHQQQQHRAPHSQQHQQQHPFHELTQLSSAFSKVDTRHLHSSQLQRDLGRQGRRQEPKPVHVFYTS